MYLHIFFREPSEGTIAEMNFEAEGSRYSMNEIQDESPGFPRIFYFPTDRRPNFQTDSIYEKSGVAAVVQIRSSEL